MHVRRHTGRHGNAVALRVEEAPYLHKLTVPLHHVLDAWRLHKKGIATGQHSFRTLSIRFGQRMRHGMPHPLVRLKLGPLRVRMQTNLAVDRITRVTKPHESGAQNENRGAGMTFQHSRQSIRLAVRLDKAFIDHDNHYEPS